MRFAMVATILTVMAHASAMVADDNWDTLRVGVQPDGRIVVPTNQILQPAGVQITFPGRPVDLALIDDGKTLVVKNMKDLLFIDVAAGQIRQTLASQVGFSAVGLVAHGDYVIVSDVKSAIHIAQKSPTGEYAWIKPITLPIPKAKDEVYPTGLHLVGDTLWIAASRRNAVQRVHWPSGRVLEQTKVGVAPYTIHPVGDDRFYVTNWGGNPPTSTDPQLKSSGTPIRVDARTNVANGGSVSVIAVSEGKWVQQKTIRVGVHPSGITGSPGGRFAYVANANSDAVSVIDTRTDEVVETIACRPEGRLPFGSGSNAVAVSPDGATLYVANGTNNCVAVVGLGTRSRENAREGAATSQLVGLIPTGWYPGAIRVSSDGKKLLVANIKGHGSLSRPRAVAKGMNSHDHLGSISIIDVPDAAQLKQYTERVNSNNRLAYSIAGLEKPRPNVRPAPVPRRHGEPSVFEHVIYVIKENRTYDQVFGDLKEGNGDPKLTIFGEEVTPNHHALARQFTLFDNFYCSGVLSADGHSWVNEAYVTDYIEKCFGGFTRSYPDDGSDPLAYANTGFLWDSALAHKKTIRNYGEFTNEKYAPAGTKWIDTFNHYKNGTRNDQIKVRPNLKTLEPYTHPGYPWFPLLVPDVYRAQLFLEDWKKYEAEGRLPNLIYVTLPCNHTNGTKPDFPTPKAMVADNDLALGRIIEAVTKSKFWPKTCIFVVEDDPQNGYDHVDGHRTVALVISPYTRRKYVDHTHYNQTGMVKTIELILGLPPMNQLDLSATPMHNCFQAKADLTPFVCLPNRIPLDQMNPPMKELKGQALHWAKKSMELNLDEGDAADEDTLNRIIWFSVRGEEPYPAKYVRPIVKGED